MNEELNKNDLYILMESYKNNIQLNTTLLIQQKQILEVTQQTIESQKNLCKNIDSLIDKIGEYSHAISSNHTNLVSEMEVSRVSCENQHKALESSMSLQHEKLTGKMNWAYLGMASIVLSVIGLAITYSQQIKNLAELFPH